MVADPFRLRSLDVEQLRGKRGAKWQQHPGARYSAWVADMDFDVAPAITDALRAKLDANEFGYPDWGGIYALSPAAKQFARRMAERYGWDVGEERLHDMCDVIQCVRVVIEHMSQPGDGVVLHLPAYCPFLETLTSMKRRLIAVAGTPDAPRAFDYDRLEAELAAESGNPGRAKVWILCHPQNPVGHVFERPELERIAQIAERFDLTVISDEVHADLTYAPGRHVPFASLGPEVASRTVTTTSASKAFNLAGMRWAVMHVGSDELQATLQAMPGHYLGAANVLAVTATVAAWTHGDEWLSAVHDALDENRRMVGRLFEQHFPGVRYQPPAATYLAWIDLRECGLGDDPAGVFRERGVEVSSGPQFGAQGTGFIRMNFATSPHILAEIVEVMAG